MAIDVQTPAAASSTSAPASPEQIDLSKLTPEQRQGWRDTGKLPAAKPSSEASATSTEENEETDLEQSEATGNEEAGEAESASTSEADKETQGKPAKRSDANTRIKELLAENKRLKAEKVAPRTEKAESSPATQQKPPQKLEAPKKPDFKDFDGKPYEEYEAAKDKYFEDLADFKAKKAVEDDRAARAQESELQKLNVQMAEGRKRYGDNFDVVIKPTVATLVTELAAVPAVVQMLNSSEVFPDLIYVIGQDPKAFAEFVATAKNDPARAIRMAVKYEQGIVEELGKGAKPKPAATTSEAQAEEEEEAGGEAPQRDPKTGKFLSESTVTRAKKPVSEVGGRGTTPDDSLVSAAQSNDMRAFKREADRRALASGK